MASPFETKGTFLMQEQADHINERHVLKHEHVRASKLESQIDLVDLLKDCLRTHLGRKQRRHVRHTRGMERISWALLFVRV